MQYRSSVPIYYATGNRKKAFVYSFLSGLAFFEGWGFPYGRAIGPKPGTVKILFPDRHETYRNRVVVFRGDSECIFKVNVTSEFCKRVNWMPRGYKLFIVHKRLVGQQKPSAGICIELFFDQFGTYTAGHVFKGIQDARSGSFDFFRSRLKPIHGGYSQVKKTERAFNHRGATVGMLKHRRGR